MAQSRRCIHPHISAQIAQEPVVDLLPAKIQQPNPDLRRHLLICNPPWSRDTRPHSTNPTVKSSPSHLVHHEDAHPDLSRSHTNLNCRKPATCTILLISLMQNRRATHIRETEVLRETYPAISLSISPINLYRSL